MAEEIKNPDIEILGQKLYFPSSILKLISFVVLMFAIVFLLCYTMNKRYSIVKGKDGFAFTVVELGKANITKGYTIGFWTPSDSTKNYLKTISRQDSLTYSWQLKAIKGNNFEEANREFGRTLKQRFGFIGYRRYRAYGEGESGYFKEGWWWNVGFQGKCDEDFLKQLKEFYFDFWSPQDEPKKWDKLYVEIIGKTEE
jgi:hypothetical protein